MTTDDASVRDDLLQGADEIATEMRTTAGQVYHLAKLVRRGKSRLPIWTEPGLGLVASRSGLRRYVQQRAEEAMAGPATAGE